jgi:D-glycero-alpha-D-manno-heptose 1-phosphate guanylyltransferase
MEAIVLAGGLGMRLRAAVPDLPKPMAPVNGRPFLEHLLDYWIAQGITRFILSVGYRNEAISVHFGAWHRSAAISYAVEEKPLGTGGGLVLARDLLSAGGTFLVLNGDTYFEVPLAALVRLHAATRADGTLALFRSPESGRYGGVRIGAEGELLALAANERGGLANGGVYLMEHSMLDGPWPAGDAVSLEGDILPFALRSGRRLYGLECPGRFLDIGVPEDYVRAGALLSAPPERRES